ncbi:MAG TPA: hypothetical protein VKP04_02320, partial [Ktedonobacteraceae bacterium]|nr:hypothetical protein [Ktedonobacteraceae bacterium]
MVAIKLRIDYESIVSVKVSLVFLICEVYLFGNVIIICDGMIRTLFFRFSDWRSAIANRYERMRLEARSPATAPLNASVQESKTHP